MVISVLSDDDMKKVRNAIDAKLKQSQEMLEAELTPAIRAEAETNREAFETLLAEMEKEVKKEVTFFEETAKTRISFIGRIGIRKRCEGIREMVYALEEDHLDWVIGMCALGTETCDRMFTVLRDLNLTHEKYCTLNP